MNCRDVLNENSQTPNVPEPVGPEMDRPGTNRPDDGASVKARLLLVRHPQVDPACHGLCYGQSDVPLSPDGRKACMEIARAVSRHAVTHVLHSGMQRTRLLAEAIARCTGVLPTEEVALRERDFGNWEMRSWQEIYQAHGDDMMKMISEPDRYRPGGGETTQELADRVWRWYRRAPRRGLGVAVCHGGTIAALLGRHRCLPVAQWPSLVPACGQMVWHAMGDFDADSPAQILRSLSLDGADA